MQNFFFPQTKKRPTVKSTWSFIASEHFGFVVHKKNVFILFFLPQNIHAYPYQSNTFHFYVSTNRKKQLYNHVTCIMYTYVYKCIKMETFLVSKYTISIDVCIHHIYKSSLLSLLLTHTRMKFPLPLYLCIPQTMRWNCVFPEKKTNTLRVWASKCFFFIHGRSKSAKELITSGKIKNICFPLGEINFPYSQLSYVLTFIWQKFSPIFFLFTITSLILH